MARTTPNLVAGIIEVDPSISVTPFIEAASMLVTDLLTDEGYSNSKLELIERWLSAHFYAIRDMRVDSEKAGPVNQKFQYKVDLGLNNTMYGQQAKMLDTSGTLANYDERNKKGGATKVGVVWLGDPES